MGLEKAAAVKAALVATLGANALGRWTTVGYAAQSVAAEGTLNNLRRVTVYYGSGAFPESRSPRVPGPWRHDMTFRVGLLVSADAKADLSVLDNAGSTPVQRAAALTAALAAAHRLDSLWDELASLVYDVLMRPSNLDLGGLPLADRWVGGVRKGEVEEHGSLVVLGGTIDYTCAAYEVATGVTPVAGESVDLSVTVSGDITGAAVDPAKQGAEATQP